ncbi:hypothetical protein PF005_g28655 [Phytophthora fragariae]|uniref:Uncharacterized protein n=3 Tax=Phytophthora fragariae TaxID=53985 RepID=A0A6A3S6R0_9STRA|nr:hypothetical protein PF003_g20365 [Phytophthora fragariae]KAE8920300.1 hypothetical protein PF009_g29402 [Phytophthora fragariae]KAE8992986.1 hypothetical protein PF011_g17323 [Phytophthora fragariae]KAE9076492.1 hypothetical protein PF006_g28118 [Phytophthora fragariae]KAE9110981.1 hypothetical protein PF007_g11640 [Phytophthora fragariae]
MFTNAIVLSTGQTAYCGPRRHMIPHSASPGHDCPQYTNPAEYLISLVNADFEDHVNVPKLAQSYTQSADLREIARIACDGMWPDPCRRRLLRPASTSRCWQTELGDHEPIS